MSSCFSMTTHSKWTLHDRNAVPEYETLIPGDTYAFTLNPSDEYQKWDCDDRIKYVQRFVNRLLLTDSFTYELYTEISHLGRIHFHGYMTMVNGFKFLLNDVRRITQAATIVVKPIDNPEIWEEYITKQASRLYFDVGYKDSQIRIARGLPMVRDKPVKSFTTELPKKEGMERYGMCMSYTVVDEDTEV